MDQVIFYIFAALAVVGALGVPLLRNPVHSALCLAGVFVSLAVLYVLLSAPFIAAAQVLIYAGAILILFLFVTMVLNPQVELGEGRLPGQRAAALVIVLALAGEIAAVLATTPTGAPTGPFTPDFIAQVGHTQAIGALLFSDFLLPFEITSLLLLVAIVGTMVLARETAGGQEGGDSGGVGS